MLAGLLMASGCEQKPAEQTPEKVTSEDVLRDAGQAVRTAAGFSQRTDVEATGQTTYRHTATKWHDVPASTNKCHTKWQYGIRLAAKNAMPTV
jgi:hypothetical protein